MKAPHKFGHRRSLQFLERVFPEADDLPRAKRLYRRLKFSTAGAINILFPLAYRGKRAYASLGNQGRAYEQTDGPGPGHTGPSDLEDPGAGAAKRLGDRTAP